MAKIHVVTPASAGTDLDDHDNLQEDGATALVWVANQAHKYKNGGVEMLRIEKGAGAAKMKVATNAPDRYGLPLPDRTIDIAANSDKTYAPLSPGAHNENNRKRQGVYQPSV